MQRISQNQIVTAHWTPSFYGYDGGGNVRQLTNAAGAVTDTYEYDAYGNHWTVKGSTLNNMFYRGEEYDTDLEPVLFACSLYESDHRQVRFPGP